MLAAIQWRQDPLDPLRRAGHDRRVPELTLRDLPPRVMSELLEWATLRKCSVEAAALEMIRIGLFQTRDRGQTLPEGLDVTDEGTRH